MRTWILMMGFMACPCYISVSFSIEEGYDFTTKVPRRRVGHTGPSCWGLFWKVANLPDTGLTVAAFSLSLLPDQLRCELGAFVLAWNHTASLPC